MITHSSKSTLTTFVQFIMIGIVGIALFAILSPVLNAAHESRIHCLQSRLQDLGRAMQQYSDDNDGMVPPGTCSFDVGKHHSLTGLGWASELYPYVTNVSDFDDAMGGASPEPSLGSVVAYAINVNASRDGSVSTWTDRSRTVVLFQVIGAHAKIDEPNEGNCKGPGACSPSGNGTIIMFMDGLFPRQAAPATGDVGGRQRDPLYDSWPTPEVDGGSYYLLGDGHIKWMRPQSVSSGSEAYSAVAVQTGKIYGHAAGSENPNYAATFSTK